MNLIGDAIGDFLDNKAREIWTGCLALLRAVLGLVSHLGQLDPTPGAGPITGPTWTTMLQLAGIIAAILFFAQLAMAVLNPRRHLLTAALGPIQYGVAMVLTVSLVVALLGAADGITTLILHQGADVTNAAATMDKLGLTDDNNAVKATVLGILGIVGVLPLAIGYGIMLLFRSASIFVLIATLPIVTAGLVNLATKHWFWRAVRWLMALIFIQPTFALCFTIGTDVVSGAGRTNGAADPGTGIAQVAPAQGTGLVTLLLGLGIMFVALFAPFALFRLFAFVEPGTQPHQTMMSAFGSAAAGFGQSFSGVANADVGSVLAGATGGRFGSSGSSGEGQGQGAGSSGGDERKQAAATAALAAATGGTSAAAGAAGGEAAAGSGSGSTGTAASAGRAPIGAGSMVGNHAGGGAAQDSEEAPSELAGAGAAAGAGGSPSGGASTAGGTGATAPTGSGTRPAGGSSGGSSSHGGGSSSNAVSGGSAPAGSLAGAWGQASSSAAAAVGSWGDGRVGAGGSAAGSVGRGALGAGSQIAGYTPMPPAPHGGVGGPTGDSAATDYSGAPPPRLSPAPNAYRDPSWDQRDDENDEGAYGDDDPDDGGRMTGVM